MNKNMKQDIYDKVTEVEELNFALTQAKTAEQYDAIKAERDAKEEQLESLQTQYQVSVWETEKA